MQSSPDPVRGFMPFNHFETRPSGTAGLTVTTIATENRGQVLR